MKKQLDQVNEFHKVYKVHLGQNDESICQLRAKLIKEETNEVLTELAGGIVFSMSNTAKELADLLYVTYGTILALGLQDVMEEVFDEVHRSNMSKLDKDGNPIFREDGKVLKSELYEPADIEGVLYGK